MSIISDEIDTVDGFHTTSKVGGTLDTIDIIESIKIIGSIDSHHYASKKRVNG